VRAIATIEARPLLLSELGERYRRYRLTDPSSEEAMARSLSSYGQLAPVTACWRDGRAELLDGFKRRAAAAQPWIIWVIRTIGRRRRCGSPTVGTDYVTTMRGGA